MSKRAFTLIEVLTVIAIIGILASITGYVYNSAMRRSRDTTRKTDLDTIKNALEQYYLDNRLYPPLVIANDGSAPLTTKYQLEKYYTQDGSKEVNKGLVPQYISTLSTDPRYKGGSGTDPRDYSYFPKVESSADANKVRSYYLGAFVENRASWGTFAPVYSHDFGGGKSNVVGNQIGGYTYEVASNTIPITTFCYRWDEGDDKSQYPKDPSGGQYADVPRSLFQSDGCTSTYYVKSGR